MLRPILLVMIALGALVLPFAEQLDLQATWEAADAEDGEEVEDDFGHPRTIELPSFSVAIVSTGPVYEDTREPDSAENGGRLERPPCLS